MGKPGIYKMSINNQQLSFIIIWLFTLIINLILAGLMGTFENGKRFRNYFFLVFLGVFIIFAVLLYLYNLGIVPDLVARLFGVN